MGIEVAWTKQGVFISQKKHTQDIVKEIDMLGCKPIATPIEANHKLGEKTEEGLEDQSTYQWIVGKLIYLSHVRIDIVYVASVVSQFIHDPLKSHLEAIYKSVKCLKATPSKWVMFQKKGYLSLEVNTNANWAGAIIDKRSKTKYCTFLGGKLITWRSRNTPLLLD